MKDEISQTFYERNSETGDYIIQISLDRYSDIFNEWDHATYLRRDMDPELAFFLEECAEEIPMQYGLELVFYLPKRTRDLKKEEIIAGVIRRYYQFCAEVDRRSFARDAKQQAKNALFAVGLLGVTYLSSLWEGSVLLSIAKEGLIIGGWVFLWGTISFFAFERSERTDRIKNYERLSNAKIYFRYDE